MRIAHLVTPSLLNPLGVKGVGESSAAAGGRSRRRRRGRALAVRRPVVVNGRSHSLFWIAFVLAGPAVALWAVAFLTDSLPALL
jgi:hypothetical protein